MSYGLIGLALAILIAACGAGDTLSGGGESGLGGTGIGLVKGDIAAVETALDEKSSSHEESILFASFKLFIAQAYAQTGSLAGITISGGGQITTTNISGEFLLYDVEHSNNLTLLFTLPFGQMFELSIGPVMAGDAVVIRDVVLNERNGGVSFGSIETLPFNGDISDFVLSSPAISAEQVIQEFEDQQAEDERRREEERREQEAEEEAEEDEQVEEDVIEDDVTCPPGEDCDGDGVPDDLI